MIKLQPRTVHFPVILSNNLEIFLFLIIEKKIVKLSVHITGNNVINLKKHKFSGL